MDRGLDLSAMSNIHHSLQNFTYFYEKLGANLASKMAGFETEKEIQVFIASPVSVSKIISAGKTGSNFKIWTTQDSLKFLKKYLKSCWVYQDYLGEILSLFEKEVISKSQIFYRARPSNWSFNVEAQRFSNKKFENLKDDSVIFDIFVRK